MANTTHTAADEAIESLDDSTSGTGMGLLRLMTFGSIAASLYLYWVADRKMDGVFVGLWAPTFEALRASTEKHS